MPAPRLIELALAFLKEASWADDPAFAAQARAFKQQQLSPTSFRGSSAAATKRVAGGLQSPSWQNSRTKQWSPGTEVGAGLPMGPTPGGVKPTATFSNKPRVDAYGHPRAAFAGETRAPMGQNVQAPFDYKQRDAARNAAVAKLKTQQASTAKAPKPAAAPARTPGPAVQQANALMDPVAHAQRTQQQQNLQTAQSNKASLQPKAPQSQQDYNLQLARQNRERLQGTTPQAATAQASQASAQRLHDTKMQSQRSEQDAFMASLPATSKPPQPQIAAKPPTPPMPRKPPMPAAPKAPTSAMKPPARAKMGAAELGERVLLRRALQIYLAR